MTIFSSNIQKPQKTPRNFHLKTDYLAPLKRGFFYENLMGIKVTKSGIMVTIIFFQGEIFSTNGGVFSTKGEIFSKRVAIVLS